MFTIALNLLSPKAYAGSITCECKGAGMLKKLDQMIGGSAKSTRLIAHGVICADIIVLICKSLGGMISGHLLKMFLKSLKNLKRNDVIQQNPGAKIIFIGKKKGVVLKNLGNTCANGEKKPDKQIPNTIWNKTLKRITELLLNGTAIHFPNKIMSVLYAKPQKLQLFEVRS